LFNVMMCYFFRIGLF